MFENLKALEPCCIILKELVAPDHLLETKSIENGLYKCYNDARWSDRLFLQTSEYQRTPQPKNSQRHNFRLAYIQLWLFCLRYFPYMGVLIPRLEPNKKRRQQTTYRQSPRYWQMLGKLALDLGFENESIQKLSQRDVVSELAHTLLLAAQPDDATYSFDKIEKIKQIVDYQTGASNPEVPSPLPEIALSRRTGRLFDQEFKQGKKYFFLSKLIGNLSSRRGCVTLLHACEDMLNSFFRLEELSVGLHFPSFKPLQCLMMY